jgi:hypothetical protein
MRATGILRDLTQDARRRRLYLPRELPQAHGISATTPGYVLAQPTLPQVCNALAEWAADWFADAEDALEGRSSGGWERRQYSCPAIAGCSGRCSSAAGDASTSRFAFRRGADQRSPSDMVSSLANAATAVP